MKEYEIRIREYKKRLPRVREKVGAALILFIVASLLLSVVTFSWLTLSVAPEAAGVGISITSNGSLEVALAKDVLRDDEGNPIYDANGNVIPVAPGASEVGDSLLDLFAKNTTWGNIINLADVVYGLENIVLRPATLNTSELLSKPLFAAKYDSDGRIIELKSDFAYTQWNSTLGQFQASSDKGVKAISSVVFDDIHYDNPLIGAYDSKIEAISLTLEQARVELNKLSSSPNMSAIDGIMSTYMNGTLRQNVDAEVCSVEDIAKFYDMMVEVYNGPVKTLGMAFMDIIELYQLDTFGQNNSTELNYERFPDLDTFCNEIETYIAEKMNVARANYKDVNGNPAPKAAINIERDFPNLATYLEDRAQLKQYIEDLAEYKGNANTTWGDIKGIVNYIVDIDTCEINGNTVTTLTGNLSTYGTELLGMIGEGKAAKNSAVVKKGLMQRLDLMLHNRVEGFKIPKATITIEKAALKKRVESSSMSSLTGMVDWVISGETGVAEANITTNARATSYMGTTKTDVDNAFEIVGAETVVKTFVAKDTYGLSIDFWVRTNAKDSFLVLEGDVIFEYIDVTKSVTLYDEEGNATVYNDVQIYLADATFVTQKGEETITTEEKDCEVFQIDGVWYFESDMSASGSSNVQEDDNSVVTKTVVGTPKKKQDRLPIGYTGANRIWTEEELEGLSEAERRTTQGSGSCYTYYADPSELSQINQILSALKVAFVNADGEIMANARLATEYCISEAGKHTVPLVLDETSLDTGMLNEDGDPVYAIGQLEQNQATLITALIYLDGNEVTNDKVLSFSNIEGSFNIQFGSTQVLDPIENEELMGEEIVVSGNVTGSNGVVNPTIDFFEGMAEQGYKTNVTLQIEGSQPHSVYAYFVRKISNTQGTKQEKITFTRKPGSADEWIAEASFYSPGTYVLTSIILDGVERSISIAEGAEPLTVTINGFSCNNFRGTNEQTHVYRTASSYVSEKFYVNISMQDDGLLPRSVEAIFMGEEGKSVTVSFTDTDHDTVYEGIATFRSSGRYTCKYLIIDGDYYELATEIVREVYTGLKVSVWISQAEGDTFDPTEEMTFNEKGYQYIHKGMSHAFNVQIRIYDNEGNAIEGLTNITLFYSRDTDATLRWDPTTKYYVGQLPIISTPGFYTFERVEVGFETISSERSAMYIRAIPSDPVAYSGIDGSVPGQIIRIEGYQGEEQPGAKVAVRMINAESAMIFGKFSRRTEDGTEYVIIKANSTTTNTQIYEFQIPDLDGVWKLEEIKMSLVYDGESSTFYMGDGTLEALFENGETYVNVMSDGAEAIDRWANSGEYYVVEEKSEWTETVIVKEMHAVSQSLSYSGHTFLDPYTLTDKVTMSHKFDGLEGVSISISNVTLTYDHAKTDTRVSWTGDTTVADVVKTLSASGNQYSLPAGSTLDMPGSYLVTLKYSVTVNGQTYNISQSLKQFTLSYTMPTVTISKVTPEGNGFAYDKTADSTVVDTSTTTGSGCDAVTTYTINSAHQINGGISEISNDKLSATVYFRCLHDGTSEYTSDQKYHAHISDAGYFNPSVTLNLAGLGSNYSSATLNFSNGNAHLYKNVSYTTSGLNGTWKTTDGAAYSWTKNGECMRYVGYCQSQKSRTGDNVNATGQKTVVGTITANSLDVVVNGVTYTLTLPTTVTINNPY